MAVINREGLLDYKLHLNKSPWSPSKANLIIATLEPCVRQYCIKRVVLSSLHVHYHTPAYKELISCLQSYCTANKIPLFIETPSSFDRVYPQGVKKSKKALMSVLVEQFPQLTYCYQKELRNKNKYYYKLFEAVAAAMLHQE
ncbi:MAG: hypothetical protein U0V75_00030 [Ferruginibacter sp.]